MLAWSSLCWLTFSHSWRLPGKLGSIATEQHSGLSVTSTQSVAACDLETQRSAIPLTRPKKNSKGPRGPPMFLLWFPHPILCAHIGTAGERCCWGLQLAPFPPQPSAHTSAKAGMKGAFQRKQTNPVIPDRSLQYIASWQSSWHLEALRIYKALPLLAQAQYFLLCVLLLPASWDQLNVIPLSPGSSEDITHSQDISHVFSLPSVKPLKVWVAFGKLHKKTFCKPKAMLTTTKKGILPLQIITQLYFSVSQSQEMKQFKSFPRHYTAFFFFFPSLWPQNNQIKYKLLFCYISIKLEEHNYW